jgi:hypothetical protein
MKIENAELRTTELFRGAPDMALDTPLDGDIMPQLTARRYFTAVDELGSPVPSSTPHSLDDLPPSAVDQEMATLFGPALKVGPDSQQSIGTSCLKIHSALGLTLDLQVPEGESIGLNSSRGGDASFALGYLGPPSPSPVHKARLAPGTLEFVYVPITGRRVVWRVRIRTAPPGDLQVCGVDKLQAQGGTDVFGAEAAGGSLDPGWSSILDPESHGGLVAVLPSRTVTDSYIDDVFGTPIVVSAGVYDVWYRLKVTSPTGARPEMTLGLFDATTWQWLGYSSYSANLVGNAYTWVRAASGTAPNPAHRLMFIAEFNTHGSALSTNWFVDEAVIVPAGDPAPADISATNP